MSPRLLILTAGFGEGHNAAARAIAEAWQDQHGPGSAPVVDLLAEASPALNRRLRRLYTTMINRAPRLWGGIYAGLDRCVAASWLQRRLQRERRALRRQIARHQPVAVCSTYPLYGFVVAAERSAGGVVAPHFVVVTDSISLHSWWWRAGAEAWFVPNGDSANVLIAAGVPRPRIVVSGFPVASAFRRLSGRIAPPELARGGGLPSVLQMVHSGTRGAEAIAADLLDHTSWRVTCAVGRDDALRQRLQARAARRPAPAQILGWTELIPQLLCSHHLLLSKAGGATTQEALAAGCPMIVTQVVPGQEQGNFELLRRHHIGARAETPAAVRLALEHAFADGGEVWRRWRDAALVLGRPDAAVVITSTIGTRLAGLPAPPASATTLAG